MNGIKSGVSVKRVFLRKVLNGTKKLFFVRAHQKFYISFSLPSLCGTIFLYPFWRLNTSVDILTTDTSFLQNRAEQDLDN